MSRIPDFTTIDLGQEAPAAALPGDSPLWATPENIDVKRRFDPVDLDGLDFLETWPGLPPFLRGPYPTM
ncbi:MAG: hypothetical protein VXY81_05250, partial [Pseudomonadota bacterium]|nr:hypothetical protein [Pseudomonadota bacterium]